MNALQIKLTGEVTDTNFEEWKTELLAQIAASKRELKTDDDFAIAESDVKSFKSGEKTLKAAKQSALEQAAAIQKLFAAIDEVTEEARQARLSLERQIKSRKEEIRDEIVDDGMRNIEACLAKQNSTFQKVNRETFMRRDALEDFTKGKRSGSGMQKAINEAVDGVKEKIKAHAELISNNEKTVEQVDSQYTALFQDKNTLLGQSAEELGKTIKERIAFFEEEQEKQKAAELAAKKSADDNADTSSTDNNEDDVDEEDEIEPEEEEEESTADLEQRHTISIEIFADASRANEFLDELEGRYSHREMIGEIRLEK